jgi:sugar phosphate isomerase/epimerase
MQRCGPPAAEFESEFTMATNSIPLACSDFSFLQVSHDLALDIIAGLGFDGADVSLMLGYSHLPVEEVLEMPESWGQRVRTMLSDRGLATADVNFLPGGDFVSLAVNHPEEARRGNAADLFRRALDFAGAAGSRHMTMLPGVPWEGEPACESLGRSARELWWRVAEARARGITLSVEAHVGSIAPSPSAAAQLLELTPGLTLTLDLTHFVSLGYSQDECMPLVNAASHFHARGGAPGKLQATAEDNIIDYGRVLQSMKDGGYSGYFEVEYEWNEWCGCNRVDVLAETVLMRDLALRNR